MKDDTRFFENEDDDILGEFLIEDVDDIDVIIMPKTKLKKEEVLEDYYQKIKRCKNKKELMNVLDNFYTVVYELAGIEREINYLQVRAKVLEYEIEQLNKPMEE